MRALRATSASGRASSNKASTANETAAVAAPAPSCERRCHVGGAVGRRRRK